jgi:hypothetical protein
MRAGALPATGSRKTALGSDPERCFFPARCPAAPMARGYSSSPINAAAVNCGAATAGTSSIRGGGGS